MTDENYLLQCLSLAVICHTVTPSEVSRLLLFGFVLPRYSADFANLALKDSLASFCIDVAEAETARENVNAKAG